MPDRLNPAQDPINYQQILFDERGAPYWLTRSGRKVFLPPLSAMQSGHPRAVEWARSMGVHQTPDGQTVNRSAPGSSFTRERGHWDSDSGEWDQDLNWNNIIATGVGAQIAAPYVIPALAGSGAASGAPTAAFDAAPSIGTAQGAANAAALGGTGGAGAVPAAAAPSFGTAAVGAGAEAGRRTIMDRVRDFVSDPRNMLRLGAGGYAAVNAFGGGGMSDEESGLLDEARQGMALQRRRLEQTQPVFDTLVRMAYGSAPTRHRGAAPEGYTESPGPQGPYRYQSPRFGG